MNSARSIVRATRDYEAWLAGEVRVVRADLQTKHKLMATDGFSFLRATFYRWAQLFPVLCPKLAGAPKVLGVGDLHVENYGTWRDAEGRLVWGINDFDGRARCLTQTIWYGLPRARGWRLKRTLSRLVVGPPAR
jgi:uncharacterized protein (DUF2252 family)